MAKIKFSWEYNETHVYRIYTSDTSFDETTLPSTYYTYTYEQSPNAYNGEIQFDIDYGGKKFIMFSVTTSSGTTYGELFEVDAFNDLIVSGTDNKAIVANSALMSSLNIEHDGLYVSSTYDKETDTIFILTSDDYVFTLNAYNGSNGNLKWQKEDLTIENSNWHKQTYSFLNQNISNKLTILNGYVYVLIHDYIYIVNKNGGSVVTNDPVGSSVPFTYTSNANVNPDTNQSKITDYCFSNDGELLYMITDNEWVSRHGKNTSVEHFYLSANTLEYKTYEMSDLGYGNAKIIMPTANRDEVLLVCYQPDGTDEIVKLNFETGTTTPLINDFVTVATGNSSVITRMVEHNGRYYFGYIEVRPDNGIEKSSIVIVDDTFNLIVNRTMALFNSNADLDYIFNILPLDDGKTVYLMGEQIPIMLYNPVDDILYNVSTAQGNINRISILSLNSYSIK